jgi:hypothetical protein
VVDFSWVHDEVWSIFELIISQPTILFVQVEFIYKFFRIKLRKTMGILIAIVELFFGACFDIKRKENANVFAAAYM